MSHSLEQPLRVGLSRFVAYMSWGVLRDQPYGVGIEPLIRGSVDAVRQPYPTKRLTPMGLSASENARGLCDFRRNIGHIPLRVYMGVRKKHANKPLGLVFW